MSVLAFIDASCVLIYGLIPETSQGVILDPPLPQAPQSGAIGSGPRSVPRPLTSVVSGSECAVSRQELLNCRTGGVALSCWDGPWVCAGVRRCSLALSHS